MTGSGGAGPEFTQIACEVVDRVMTITLSRPDRLNAFTPRMGRELASAIDLADADDDVRAVVVTGTGRGFCAGADLQRGGDTFRRPAADPGTAPAPPPVPRDEGGLVTLRIFESTKPFIAAVNGPAVGVGATMTLPMDFRLASTSARFAFPFARRGIVPDAASAWFLPRAVGLAHALDWSMTGRMVEVEEAVSAGLVRSALPPEDLLPAAREIAAEIARNTSAVSVALTRQMLWRMSGEASPMVAHRLDSSALAELGSSADAREGITAFLEKREPNFVTGPSTGMPAMFPWWSPEPF